VEPATRPLTIGPALEVALLAASAVLRRLSVHHALAGGIAVNIWGRQRLTTDVDFAVLVESADALRSVVRSAQPEGFVRLDPRPLQFARAWVERLVIDPESVPSTPEPVIVDLVRPVGRGARPWLLRLLERAVDLDVLGTSLPVVLPEDLVLFKLLVRDDRGYDLADAASVLEEAGPSLDTAYLVEQATALGVRRRLRGLGV